MTLSIRELRYIDDGADLSSAEGLAADEVLCHSVAAGLPSTIRLYTYRPAVIVGRYQNLADAIDLDACRLYGYEWNRRYTGGGTVMMGPKQLAVGLVLPEQRPALSSIRKHFEYFAGILSAALGRFDVYAEFAGKNDLVVDGRKVAGLAISQDIDGVVFFHASILWDFDVRVMVEILNLATRGLDDRGHSCFARRMTTVREHADVTLEGLKHALVSSLGEHHNIQPTRMDWLPEEREQARALIVSRYECDDWIYSDRVMRRWTGSAERKTEGGLLRVYVDRAGGVVDSVLITGDYFSRGREVARLESQLRGVSCRESSILRAVEESSAASIYRVPDRCLAGLIGEAANQTGRRFLARPARKSRIDKQPSNRVH